MDSILSSTKDKVGVVEENTVFDAQIIDDINAAFARLQTLGVGPLAGFSIQDEDDFWEDYDVPSDQLSFVKVYIGLKVRMVFDTPQTSFLREALEKQIAEQEWMLAMLADAVINPLSENTA